MFGSRFRSLALSAGLLVGAAVGPAAAPGQASGLGVAGLCADYNYGGGCQYFWQDVPNLIGSNIGNDRASSVRVAPGTHLLLYSDVNFRGVCQEFTGDVPNLSLVRIGNDSASSLRLTLSGGCGTGSSAPVA